MYQRSYASSDYIPPNYKGNAFEQNGERQKEAPPPPVSQCCDKCDKREKCEKEEKEEREEKGLLSSLLSRRDGSSLAIDDLILGGLIVLLLNSHADDELLLILLLLFICGL